MVEAYWNELKSRSGFDWLVEAKRYLQAADVLRISAEYQLGLIFTPTLHVLAHGIELFLKANLIINGIIPAEAESFGHDIWRLWSDDRNGPLRADVLTAAEEEWVAASMDPSWNGDFSKPSAVLFEEYLKRLSELNTGKTKYALRYVRPEGTEAPKPHMLGPTFYRVCGRYLRDMAQAKP